MPNQSGSMQSGALGTLAVHWLVGWDQPIPVDGPTTWVSSAPTVVQCTVSPGNPLIANLHALGPLGTATITATADSNLAVGVNTITAGMDITVHA